MLEKFKKEVANILCADNESSCFNLVYIDLDRFIYHNDAFGRASGDEALSKIQNALFLLFTAAPAAL